MCMLRHAEIRAPTTNDTENDTEPREIKYFFRTRRRSTDRYWTWVFVVVLIVWIASWYYLINSPIEGCDDCNDYRIDAHNGEDTTSGFASFHWFIDIITCNIRFLDTLYQTKGSILIWLNVLFCVLLIAYLLISMRSDYVFCNQIFEFGKIFMIHMLAYRASAFFLIDFDIMKKLLMHYDENIALWMIPELIFIVIWATKNSPKKPNSESYLTINYHTFKRHTLEILAVPVFFLETVITVTAVSVCELSWDNPLFYAVAGGSFYMGSTIFYFGLMVRACATSNMLNDFVDNRKITHWSRAVYIVGRYHFGTVCYHATLVFPRLHAVLVANEAEFRRTPNFSTVKRFYVTQWRLHNVSPIVTAVLGENHSTSIRELLCQNNTSDSSNMKHYQGFAEVCTYFFVLMVSANSLIFILLWTQGAIVDPLFPTGTWMMILIVIFLTYIYMRADDALLDAILFNVDDENQVKF